MDNKEKKKGVKKEEPKGFDALLKTVKSKWKDMSGEFKKIIWPDRKSLIKHTVNVIIISGVIGGVIVLMDLVFSQGYTLFINLLQ
ncbi:MAG: preprotein translocase subunit SecE [Defluviitaleaceae bacterium]|nr:preprotein translocase subunit SecE [Defluviitaleaceae bacterium]MCL2836997.1 preprotein translocase subunit SecE [Defluviitaleaceae bacterium]